MSAESEARMPTVMWKTLSGLLHLGYLQTTQIFSDGFEYQRLDLLLNIMPSLLMDYSNKKLIHLKKYCENTLTNTTDALDQRDLVDSYFACNLLLEHISQLQVLFRSTPFDINGRN